MPQVQKEIGRALDLFMNTFYLPAPTGISRIVNAVIFGSSIKNSILHRPNWHDHRGASRSKWRSLRSDITTKESGAPSTDLAKSPRNVIRKWNPLSVHGAPMSFAMKLHHLWRRDNGARQRRNHPIFLCGTWKRAKALMILSQLTVFKESKMLKRSTIWQGSLECPFLYLPENRLTPSVPIEPEMCDTWPTYWPLFDNY